VLHVIKTLSLGGAETNLLNLVRALDPERVEPHVAYSWGGEIEPRFKESGVRLFKYADASHKIKSIATLGIVLRLAAYIVRHRIDVVHTHVFNAHVWGGMAARLTGCSVVEHVHDMRYVSREERDANNCHVDQFKHARLVRNLSDGVIVLTGQNKRYVVDEGLHPEEKVWLIRNGIRITEGRKKKNAVHEAGRSPLIYSGRTVFLTPARMSGEKNIDLIFRMIPLIVKECPSALFLIAGDGPMLEAYKKRAAEEGLWRHLQFLGFQKDIKDLLSITYAMLLPSFIELHPIAILEALSMRVPVVVSAGVGCNSEIFTDGENALLLDPRSPAAWADALIRLMRDPARRNSIGSAGFELCRNEFDIHHVAEKIESVYEHLIR